MFEPINIVLFLLLYIGTLFMLARWTERKSAQGKSPVNNPIVYSLSLAVYCTSWTYYGSVGKAATSGMLFLAIYLGPTLAIILGWSLLRKMIRIKNNYRITSIADFISARYNKSQALAALATIVALLGIMPYIALQLKAITSTFTRITPANTGSAIWSEGNFSIIIVAFMVIFTIMFGVRRLDPTERHESIVMVLAVECIVKLFAFMAVGIFVTYGLHNGFHDVFANYQEISANNLISVAGQEPSPYLLWMTYLILATSAILFLPRQFHVAVIENSSEKHIRTAMWLFPLYMLLINLFVLPIALKGLSIGYSVNLADIFVLELPLDYGKPWLALLVFLGGFSAATGMIMISSMTLSTMITNHLLLPLIGWIKELGFLRKHLLKCRWLAVIAVLFLGYFFERAVGDSYMLVNIGMISFAAVLQFAPAILGGLYWRQGNKAGAILGLSAGFFIWLYTSLIPSFVKSGWISHTLLNRGPLGIEFLKPEQLFGVSGLDPLSHTVFWSMFFNIGFYILASLFFQQKPKEQNMAKAFVATLSNEIPVSAVKRRDAYIELKEKKKNIEHLLNQFFKKDETEGLVSHCIDDLGLKGQDFITIQELVELYSKIEISLAGSIGSAEAHKAMKDGMIFTLRESTELADVYSEILANLKVSPEELQKRIDYHQERESLLMNHANVLEEMVKQRDKQIIERLNAENALYISNETLTKVLDSLEAIVYVSDMDNYELLYVNKYLQDQFGDVRGKICWKSLQIGQTGPCPFCTNDKLLTKDGQPGEPVIWEFKNTLTKKWFSIYNRAIQWVDGRIVRLEIAKDITLRKNSEMEREALIQDLESKNEELERFSYTVSHDLKTPLVTIKGFLGLLQTDMEAKDEVKINQDIQRISNAAEKMHDLLNDLLNLCKIGRSRNQPEYIKLKDLIEESIELVDGYISRQQIEIDIKDALPVIHGDRKRILEVFQNLIENAIKYMGDQAKPRIEIGMIPDHLEHIIYVQDNGMGIDKRYHDSIFGLFNKLDLDIEGTGIGLALVKRIIESHDGHIWVESADLGKGSTFYFTFPFK